MFETELSIRMTTGRTDDTTVTLNDRYNIRDVRSRFLPHMDSLREHVKYRDCSKGRHQTLYTQQRTDSNIQHKYSVINFDTTTTIASRNVATICIEI